MNGIIRKDSPLSTFLWWLRKVAEACNHPVLLCQRILKTKFCFLCLGFRRGKQLWVAVSVSSPLGKVGRRDWGDLQQIWSDYWLLLANPTLAWPCYQMGPIPGLWSITAQWGDSRLSNRLVASIIKGRRRRRKRRGRLAQLVPWRAKHGTRVECARTSWKCRDELNGKGTSWLTSQRSVDRRIFRRKPVRRRRTRPCRWLARLVPVPVNSVEITKDHFDEFDQCHHVSYRCNLLPLQIFFWSLLLNLILKTLCSSLGWILKITTCSRNLHFPMSFPASPMPSTDWCSPFTTRSLSPLHLSLKLLLHPDFCLLCLLLLLTLWRVFSQHLLHSWRGCTLTSRFLAAIVALHFTLVSCWEVNSFTQSKTLELNFTPFYNEQN